MTDQFFSFPDAVFLDRDGTIIEDKHYLCQPEGVVLLPGAETALAQLAEAGCKLMVVTNQSGIGRGKFTQAQYLSVEKRLDDLLAAHEVKLTATRYCPHAPAEEGDAARTACACRKPGTGMWEDLRAEYGLTPARCVMVGDKMADLLFGKQAGFAASFLVLTGKGPETAQKWGLPLPAQDQPQKAAWPAHNSPADSKPGNTALYTAKNLAAVAAFLLEH